MRSDDLRLRIVAPDGERERDAVHDRHVDVGQQQVEFALLQPVERVGPVLREKGIIFAGLDVIGDYLTEINVTSPTCIRELDKLYNLDIAGDLLVAVEKTLN